MDFALASDPDRPKMPKNSISMDIFSVFSETKTKLSLISKKSQQFSTCIWVFNTKMWDFTHCIAIFRHRKRQNKSTSVYPSQFLNQFCRFNSFYRRLNRQFPSIGRPSNTTLLDDLHWIGNLRHKIPLVLTFLDFQTQVSPIPQPQFLPIYS